MATEGATEVAAMILKKFGKFFKRQYEEINGKSVFNFNNNLEEKCYPIGIESSMKENISVMDLVESDNVLINKILIVFSSLCIEIIHLKEEAISRHYVFISLYGDSEVTKKDSILQHVSQHMEALCRLSSFISRCQEVCKNILSQIFSLFTSELITLNGARLHYVIDNVGELLEILVTLELLIANSPIVEHWMAFKKNIKQILSSPKKYNFTEERLKALELALKDMDSKMMPEKIFQFTLNSLLILRQTLAEKSCAPIATEFNVYIKYAISELDKATIDIFESWQIRKWIKVNALVVLNCFLFGNTDKKMFRSLVEVNVKAHSIPLYSTAMWYPEQFLQRYLPALCQAHGKLSQMMVKSRQSYIANKKSTISRDANSAQTATTQWVLALEVAFRNSDTRPNAAQMNQRSQLLLKGIDLASQINFLITVILNLHLSQGIPVTKSLLISVFRLLEVLKGIQEVFKKKNYVISTSNNMIIQHLIFQTVSLIINMKKGLIDDKNYARQRLDELTSIVVAERSLRGPVTLQRRVLAKTALSLIPIASHSDDTYAKLDLLLSRIDSLSNLYQNIDSLCNGSHLYFHKTIIPIYMTQFFTRKYDSVNMKYLFDSLNDCSAMLSDGKIVPGSSYDLFNKVMENSIQDYILKPVGQQIETNLRLHIHSHLQLDPVNPFIKPIENNKPLLQAKNLRFVHEYLSINLSVEHYLSHMFYNLTTVVLHDWRTYGEMRQLAKFKFNLETVQDNLPTQTLEQGLDVLEIMRNIHVFVSKYLYNLNNQIFIEQSSNNKYLNSINITHVANSIRTHGTGIMNTTVNFTYQFLRKKFYTFSQFMYDEHIKSRLIKDLRKFRETASETGNMYSYKNADKFNKGIRNLGISDGGQSYLDLFRILISQIGNAMGYVRMIRSGGRHCCANSTAFLPSLDATLKFKEMCQNEHLSPLTIAAADNLEHTINTMTTNFAQGTEYFKLLVDVFAPIFRNKKNVHLKNFYMIVPPLTINFVENMILSKDKITKKNKDGAAFTDDGFAMGLAYILKLLDQDNDLNSLHWFQAVWKHIADERTALEAQRLKGSAQLQQALALTEKKFHILDEEFQMLYFSFSSARIFFQ